MRVLRRTKDQLVLQEWPWGTVILSIIFVVVGGFIMAISSSATLSCERAAGLCTLERSGLVGGGTESIALSDIERAYVREHRSSEGGVTYSLALETRQGTVPLLSSSDSARAGKQQVAQEINGFLQDESAPSLVARQDNQFMLVLFGGLFAGVGLLTGLFGASVVTVSFDRLEGLVTSKRRSLVRHREASQDLAAVTGIVINERRSTGKNQRLIYNVNLKLATGELYPISDTPSTGLAGKRVVAEKVRDFLDLPAVEEASNVATINVATIKDVVTFFKEAQAKREEALLGTAPQASLEAGAFQATLQEGGTGIGRFAVGVPIRAVAVFIDFLALAFFAYLLSRLGLTLGFWTFSWTLVAFLYYSLYEGFTGATLGKHLLGLRVVRLDGSPITWREAGWRNALRFVDGFAFYLVGAIAVMRSPSCQRLGDRVAGTVVVMRRSLPALREPPLAAPESA